MGTGFYPHLRDILLANGCVLVRHGKGSHEIWRSPISGKAFPVAVTVQSRHTANGILKDAGIAQKL
ncbi:MAG: type II toxin-antitoxin system HicA family toxin [Candidatus Methylumidiphilus sp.]